MIRRNKKASIWEVLVLFALNQAFPSFDFTNEYPLKKIPNQSNIDLRHRFYDIYSEKVNIAVEVSRIGAHNSQEHLVRDTVKQAFTDETDITLFHLRDKQCENSYFSNVITFTVGKNTKDILFPIRTLKPAIDKLLKEIESRTNTKRKKNINYGRCVEDILEFYERISGKVFDESALVNLSDEEMSEKLNIDFAILEDCKKRRKMSQMIFFLKKMKK